MNGPARPLTRREFLSRTLAGGAGLAALGGVGAAQVYRFGVTRQEARLPGLRAPLRVAFLTDLHYGPFIGEGSVRAWVDATNSERPGLILLGGDFIDRHAATGDRSPLLRELARLRAPLGAYGVWGNHDYAAFSTARAGQESGQKVTWEQERAAHAAAFAGAGITILRNEGRAVRDDLFLGGTDDVLEGEPDPGAALAGAGERATLLLSHNPDLLPELPRAAGLALCGHTHGGQVRLPLIGALAPLIPSRYGARFDMGWKQGAFGTPAYVSRGLGVSGVPLRNLCEPEVLLLTLRPA